MTNNDKQYFIINDKQYFIISNKKKFTINDKQYLIINDLKNYSKRGWKEQNSIQFDSITSSSELDRHLCASKYNEK